MVHISPSSHDASSHWAAEDNGREHAALVVVAAVGGAWVVVVADHWDVVASSLKEKREKRKEKRKKKKEKGKGKR